jgi:DNA-binding GntR family transcriptional regulator
MPRIVQVQTQPPPSGALKPANNRFSVASQLEERILTGKIKPGGRLPEMALARELGVSQAGIREALQELESLGLVVKHPNRGSFVIEIDAIRLQHIFQVRRELEPLACSLLAGHLAPEALDSLQRCLADMKAASERNDYPAYLDADLRFHRTLWASQPNRLLERSLCTACLPLFAYDLIRRYSSRYQNFPRAIRQHQWILDAILTGEAARVSRITRRLVDRWFQENLADYSQSDQKSIQETAT